MEGKSKVGRGKYAWTSSMLRLIAFRKFYGHYKPLEEPTVPVHIHRMKTELDQRRAGNRSGRSLCHQGTVNKATNGRLAVLRSYNPAHCSWELRRQTSLDLVITMAIAIGFLSIWFGYVPSRQDVEL